MTTRSDLTGAIDCCIVDLKICHVWIENKNILNNPFVCIHIKILSDLHRFLFKRSLKSHACLLFRSDRFIANKTNLRSSHGEPLTYHIPTVCIAKKLWLVY